MTTEIKIIVTHPNKEEPLFEDRVYGEGPTMTFLSSYIESHEKVYTKDDNEAITIKYNDKDSKYLKKELQYYEDSEDHLIQKVDDEITDLRNARSGAFNAKIFQEFTDLLANSYAWIENHRYSIADRFVNTLNKAEDVILKDFAEEKGFSTKYNTQLYRDYNIELILRKI